MHSGSGSQRPAWARRISTLAGVGGAALLAFTFWGPSENASAQNDALTGLVVSQIEYALSDDFTETGACPAGLSIGSIEAYERGHPDESVRLPNETEREYRGRISAAARVLPDGRSICLNPEAAGPDPNFQTVVGRDIRAYGIDLDGRASRNDAPPGRGTCAHNDFRSRSGVAGVDNQFYRVMGCVHSYQPDGAFNAFGDEMRAGGFGILIGLRGVDDLVNDRDIEVTFYSNADRLQVDGEHNGLPFVTYAAENEPRYIAATRGRIVDGVLTSDPVDFTFRQSVHNYGVRLERELQDARVELTLDANGAAEGILAGYTPIDHLWANQFSYAAATGGDPPEQLPALIPMLRDNIPQSHGYTCNGVYAALVANADGDPDPETGRCRSISIQYRISAVPAFILPPGGGE